jgi:hypothetical protein
MKQILAVALLSFVFCSACENEPPANAAEMHNGHLRNYTGLDGCGWVIVDDDNTVYEPINLDDFGIDLVDYAAITFTFEEINDMGSICMVGPIIELVTVKVD